MLFLQRLNNYNTGVTVELGRIVEQGVKLWDFDYPSYYTGDQKKAFEQKVIDHYYFRQIGQETVGRFLHYFRARMREIMPYYIERYRTVEVLWEGDDPLKSYYLTETYKRTGKGSNKSTDTSESSSQADARTDHRFSDTPQGSLDNLDEYLTEATLDNTHNSGKINAKSTGSAESNSQEEYTLSRTGNIGVQTKGEEITKFRQALLNVDMEIIEELNDLFLMVY